MKIQSKRDRASVESGVMVMRMASEDERDNRFTCTAILKVGGLVYAGAFAEARCGTQRHWVIWHGLCIHTADAYRVSIGSDSILRK
jgi:hypothetical protein